MFLLDLLVDIAVEIYTSLGYGTPQRKINVKVDKIAKEHNDLSNIYYSYQAYFESDKYLSDYILKKKIKTSFEKEEAYNEIIRYLIAEKKIDQDKKIISDLKEELS